VQVRCEIDHVFICTSRRAPVAELLVRAGLTEGSPNRHPGQGTACRRFFFSNAMLELIWLDNEIEARSEQTRRTGLFERLSNETPGALSDAGRTASPFGVILRPSPDSEAICPWPSWSYRPPTMPGLELEIASDTDPREPMWCWMKSGRAPAQWPPERRQPVEHPAGFREVTGVRIGCRDVRPDSVTSTMARTGVIGLETGVEHRLELHFDGGSRGAALDFRPGLPLILCA
jgi:hypothetical protein